MTTKKKTLTIGDIHGRDNWLKIADLKILSEYPYLETEYDYYIFTGDYVDSYTVSGTQQLDILKLLVQLKKNYPEQVILLLGNHDLEYIYPLSDTLKRCPGMLHLLYFDFNQIFRENEDLFQAAFQIDNYIWTHAGIHRDWYLYDFPFNSPNIADDINGAYKQNVKSLFQIEWFRGGNDRNGGPFWVHKTELWRKPLIGYHQIVGHTATKSKKVETNTQYKDKDTSITIVDCLEHNEYYILEI
jgi:hypothetical protein